MLISLFDHMKMSINLYFWHQLFLKIKVRCNIQSSALYFYKKIHCFLSLFRKEEFLYVVVIETGNLCFPFAVSYYNNWTTSQSLIFYQSWVVLIASLMTVKSWISKRKKNQSQEIEDNWRINTMCCINVRISELMVAILSNKKSHRLLEHSIHYMYIYN